MLQIPTDRKILELPSAVVWFDDDGILNVKSKGISVSMEIVKANGEALKKFLAGKKVCCLYDTSAGAGMDQQTASWVNKQLEGMYTAIAVLSNTKRGNIAATVLTVITPSLIPLQIFNAECEAREWLKQYNCTSK